MNDQGETDKKNPQLIYSWKAPLRAYKKRPAGVLRFYLALSLLLSLIALLLGDRILILPILAVMFLFYVLTTTPPQTVEHHITKFGIESTGDTYRWDFLSHFYFTKRFDYYVLTIVSHAPYYYHIYLVAKDQQNVNDLIKILSEHLIYNEHPQKTFSDRLIELLTRLMPDEVISPPIAKEVVSEKEMPPPL